MIYRCKTCGEYIYKGKKFNARKEDVEGEDYLGIRIYRFYIKVIFFKFLCSIYIYMYKEICVFKNNCMHNTCSALYYVNSLTLHNDSSILCLVIKYITPRYELCPESVNRSVGYKKN